jgi:hypothetical protein
MRRLLKQWWFGELHPTTSEQYMKRKFPNLDFGFELRGNCVIARIIQSVNKDARETDGTPVMTEEL